VEARRRAISNREITAALACRATSGHHQRKALQLSAKTPAESAKREVMTLLTTPNQSPRQVAGLALVLLTAAIVTAVVGAVLLGAATSLNFAGRAGIAALAVLGAAGGGSLVIGIWLPGAAPCPAPRAADRLVTYCANLTEGLSLVRPDSTIVFSNPAFWQLLRQDQTTSTTFVLAEALYGLPASQEALYRLSTAAESGKAWEEVIEQPANVAGAINSRWLRVSVQPGPEEDGRIAYVAWRISDATSEHNRQNDAIQRLRRNLDCLDQVPAGVFAIGADGRLGYVNKTLADWLGTDVSAATSAGLTVEQVLEFEAPFLPADEIIRQLKDGKFACDAQLRDRGVGPIPVRLIGQVQPDGRTLSAGVLLSRSPPVAPAAGGTATEARFTRLFQAAPIAIATINSQGRIGNANSAFWHLFGWPLDRQAANGVDVLKCVHEDSRPALRKALKASGEGEAPVQPVDIVLVQGKRRAAQVFVGPNPAADSGEESVILFALDTTERKELEAQFAQSQKMQAIGQLAGGIAHDINNVLTVIIGFSDLLLANSAGDPAFHDLNEIKANANRAANLVRQLLAYSRRQTLRPEVLSLNEVISDLTVFLKRSLGEKILLERDYGRDLWLIRADQTELGRVLVNLAVNAVDAMPNGGKLTIRTANVSREQTETLALTGLTPGDYIKCEVSDSGHGMPPEVLERIFEPFFTTKDVGKGTGLGLSTVYGIVKQTGGYIYCESSPGAGTCFRIFLPRHALGSGSGTAEAAPKADRHDKSRDLTGSGTVLLVEDEESVRRFAARALRRQGYHILEAANGIEALEVKARHSGSIDLVVSDIVMPEMDGPTLLKELRKTNPELKIIFMSGYADDALSNLDSGEEFAFLSKPFQLTELVSVVKEALSR
jgi:two-component system, cell cycle sensor histidine kinase and response regulator CckA